MISLAIIFFLIPIQLESQVQINLVLFHCSWWKHSSVSKLIAVRKRSIENYLPNYLLAVSVIYNVDFGSIRIALAKATTLVSLLDDLFDDYLTLDQVELITKAIVQGWNISIIENIPHNYKRIVEFIFKTLHELTSEASQIQGCDMMEFITKVVCILSLNYFLVTIIILS